GSAGSNGSPGPTGRGDGFGGPPGRSGADPSTPAGAVQPGLWLAAFTEGVNGTGPADHDNGDTTGRDER
ncbi:hypothetical protein VR45_41235, partial [Streptomyces sp. NRRL S-495]